MLNENGAVNIDTGPLEGIETVEMDGEFDGVRAAAGRSAA